MKLEKLQAIVEKAFEDRANLSPRQAEGKIVEAVSDVIDLLDPLGR
jgi:gamma-glutamyl phosphate reductase